MRKPFTIGIAVIMLIAGMHVTIAGHYCGGKLASIRISLSGKSASCGMEEHPNPDKDRGTALVPLCCDNVFATYSIDPNYLPEIGQPAEKIRNVSHFPIAAVNLCLLSHIPVPSQKTPVGPPGNVLANAVNRTVLCVFRI